jgi:hypothetical protein
MRGHGSPSVLRALICFGAAARIGRPSHAPFGYGFWLKAGMTPREKSHGYL